MNKKRNNINFVWLGIILGILFITLFVIFYSNMQKNMLRSGDTMNTVKNNNSTFVPEIQKTEEEWKKILTPQQYYVLREQGTDRPFDENDPLLHEKRKGTYVTADCGEPVFRSEQKFDSGTGWPSFWAPIEGSIVEHEDSTLGFSRTEVIGKKCGGHLGHVFNDGPEPTGLRYCINSSALKFVPDEIQ